MTPAPPPDDPATAPGTAPTATGTETRRAIARLLRADRVRAALALVLLVAGLAAAMAAPRVLGHMIDLVVDRRGVPSLVPWFAVLLGAALVQGALTATGGALIAAVGERLAATLRERTIGRALRLPLTRAESLSAGGLLTRVNEDMTTVSTAVTELAPTLITAAITTVLTFGSILLLDWRLALAALCCLPPQVIALRWLLRTALPAQRRSREAADDRTRHLLDTVHGADTARAFGLTGRRAATATTRSRRSMAWALRISMLGTKFYGRLNAGELLGLGAILAAGFLLVRGDAASIGAVSAAALYFHRLFDTFNILLGEFNEAQSAMIATARVVGVATLPTPEEPRATATPADFSISVRGAAHAYVPGRPVLHDVHLDIPQGRHVALVGPSGAGKTTLAALIAGIHTPTAGSVHIGGVPLDALGEAHRRRTVTLISQETHIFAGTLADDLRLAAPHAEDRDLVEALDRTGAWPWVRALPDGLGTRVGEGGRRLTATETQQIALTRLVLADPPIAILDEATADAGSAGARVLDRAAAAVLTGRTALVVAHRLTQARDADEIIVLEDGRVAERGTHAALAAAGGPYARLWSAWSATRPD
ncbi:MAG TPA: ABC transporter ATP-binding protein [Streptosporangiaceae bacterium]